MPKVEDYQKLDRIIDALAASFLDLSDRIWARPELAFHECHAATETARLAGAQGFSVTHGIGGLPTALMAEAGEGGPVIAFLGEYDALPGLSQQAVARRCPDPETGNGHGCGHNLLGVAALLAGAAVTEYLSGRRLKGRVRYYGCPAEEGGSGKVYMVRAGAFEGVDAAITWHPGPFTKVMETDSLSVASFDFTFRGRAAHASIAPHLGRSALDAVELMNVGANFLREHVPSDTRLHYAILDAGGQAPNVVPERAVVRYQIRTPRPGDLARLLERIVLVARGAAMMTETEVSHSFVSASSNVVPNPPLEAAMARHIERLGPPPFDEADRAFAREIAATLDRRDVEAAYLRFSLEPAFDQPLFEGVLPPSRPGASVPYASDVGDVSWVVPTVQARVATCAVGTPGHSWQMVAQGRSGAAHKGLVHAARIMAGTALDLFLTADLLQAAKAAHRETCGNSIYVCPIPDTVQPPIGASCSAPGSGKLD